MADQCRSCQAEVIFVPSAKTGKPMILDAKPEKRVVVGEPVLGIESNPILVGGSGTAAADIRLARVVDTYVDHHATCPASAAWKGRHR